MHPNQPVRIDYLCGQPFWKFSKKEKENYCKVCKHGILDLTSKSESEVKHLLEQNKNGLCGSFYKDQFVIDQRTQHSPATFKLILAGMISWFSATSKIHAQSGAPVPVEQHYLGSDSPAEQTDKKSEAVHKDEKPVCSAQIPVSASAQRRKYYRIGKSAFYISGRFPFIHKRKMVKGRFRY